MCVCIWRETQTRFVSERHRHVEERKERERGKDMVRYQETDTRYLLALCLFPYLLPWFYLSTHALSFSCVRAAAIALYFCGQDSLALSLSLCVCLFLVCMTAAARALHLCGPWTPLSLSVCFSSARCSYRHHILVRRPRLLPLNCTRDSSYSP